MKPNQIVNRVFEMSVTDRAWRQFACHCARRVLQQMPDVRSRLSLMEAERWDGSLPLVGAWAAMTRAMAAVGQDLAPHLLDWMKLRPEFRQAVDMARLEVAAARIVGKAA